MESIQFHRGGQIESCSRGRLLVRWSEQPFVGGQHFHTWDVENEQIVTVERQHSMHGTPMEATAFFYLPMECSAAGAGLSHSMISLIVRQLRNPTLDTLLCLCSVLEVDLGDLINQAARNAARKSRK